MSASRTNISLKAGASKQQMKDVCEEAPFLSALTLAAYLNEEDSEIFEASTVGEKGGLVVDPETGEEVESPDGFGVPSVYSAKGLRVTLEEKGICKEEGEEPVLFSLKKFIDEAHTDTQAYAALSNDGSILVFACRGTTSIKDWITDLIAARTRWEPHDDLDHAGHGACFDSLFLCCTDHSVRPPMVHLGFYSAFLPLRKHIREQVLPILRDPSRRAALREIIFCGHSLGGALAVQCLAYFLSCLHKEEKTLLQPLLSSGARVTLFTLGAPRVGGPNFLSSVRKDADALHKKPLADHRGDRLRIIRVVNHFDVVTMVPPSMQGFLHLEGAWRYGVVESEAEGEGEQAEVSTRKFLSRSPDESLTSSVKEPTDTGDEIVMPPWRPGAKKDGRAVKPNKGCCGSGGTCLCCYDPTDPSKAETEEELLEEEVRREMFAARRASEIATSNRTVKARNTLISQALTEEHAETLKRLQSSPRGSGSETNFVVEAEDEQGGGFSIDVHEHLPPNYLKCAGLLHKMWREECGKTPRTTEERTRSHSLPVQDIFIPPDK
uniref:Fungal lipase-type domain-containing protein n=1 Tax=Chromera velia CCMP2878 TaxID=1169474 RepID=A0A0G4FA03_9ALVE|eukprot:Cvel_2979.t1-p1 / transcript=Cvel_2979.t1 / gene=Cvel_2979 / organism=Chromera_velia_CCMP2878 / gene_product=Lipase, putative / transcript_product=Lipase, putative / location=Cvel_scaffold118:68829-73542(-) / protein_length=549 / sequence_SO=supercontig / SO=protein_coding / is_pseudo=false